MNATIKAAYWAQMQAHNYWLKDTIDRQLPAPTGEPILNMPILIDADFMESMLETCAEIVKHIQSGELTEQTRKLIDADKLLGNINTHPSFLSIDFAASKNTNGNIVPQLIELQGFPSILAFALCAGNYYDTFSDSKLQHSWIPNTPAPVHPHEQFKQTVLGKQQASDVVLLDFQPDAQATCFDFMLTEKLTGVKRLCLTAVERKGNQLFANHNGTLTPIKRIYNRLILTSLSAELQHHARQLFSGADVEWAAHPDWFALISKASLPALNTMPLSPTARTTIPWSARLSDVDTRQLSLENFIVKPLLDFGSKGIQLHPTHESINAIPDPQNYLIQQRVEYARAVHTPAENLMLYSEYRVMMTWEDDAQAPVALAVLVRVNSTPKLGVRQHQRSPWTGISIALHSTAPSTPPLNPAQAQRISP